MNIRYANLLTSLISSMTRSWKAGNIGIFYETPDVVLCSFPEIWEGSFRMNKMFIRPEARLNIVHFQKGSVSRDQLIEFYHIRVEPV